MAQAITEKLVDYRRPFAASRGKSNNPDRVGPGLREKRFTFNHLGDTMGSDGICHGEPPKTLGRLSHADRIAAVWRKTFR